MVVDPKQMKALKLDSTYRPIAVIDALEALVMCLVGKAKTIESYEGVVVNSPTRSFSLPSVIVLNTIVNFKFTIVSCNRRNVVMKANKDNMPKNPQTMRISFQKTHSNHKINR